MHFQFPILYSLVQIKNPETEASGLCPGLSTPIDMLSTGLKII